MPGIDASQCVLVIGATGGIGRALALAIQGLPSGPTVIVAGRRQERLDELLVEGKKRGGRLDALRVDVAAGANELKTFVERVTHKYPQLDTVVFSSGVQCHVDFTCLSQDSYDLLNTETTTNYVSVVTLVQYFLPHLLGISAQGRPSFLIPISSFLAIMPMGHVPGYCATKAAIHALCICLRQQLTPKGVHVIEILPPLVESELHDKRDTTLLSKFWMPLDVFTAETMQGLLRGDREIYPVNQATYDRFEKGKIEAIEDRMAAIAAAQKVHETSGR